MMRKRLWTALGTCALACTWIAVSSTASTAAAAEPAAAATTAPEATPAESAAPQTTDAMRAKLTSQQMILGSGKLQDLDVYDRQGNKLGNLDNLIVDAHTSHVLCGILDTGIAGKLVPVPWKAFQLVKKDDEYRLSLDSSAERLKDAPTYDDGNRPDFADPKWQQRVDGFFGVQSDAWPTMAEKSTEKGEDSEVLRHEEMIFESSKLGDLNVYNRDEKKLGNLDDLIVDAHAGRVLYGILDTGIGGKLIPVPWNALLVQKYRQENRYSLLLGTTEDQLANAPTYDPDHKPDFTDSQWKATVDEFFGVHSAARPIMPEAPSR